MRRKRNYKLLCRRATKTVTLLEQVKASLDKQPLEAARVLLKLLCVFRLNDESAERLKEVLREAVAIDQIQRVVEEELVGLQSRTRVLSKAYCRRV